MKISLTVFVKVCLVIFVLCAWGGRCDAADLYVAPDGKDTNPGTRNAPFATLERARDAARNIRKSQEGAEGITVWLRGGVYRLDRTLELTGEDSGATQAPTVWRSVEGEQVRIVGGVSIPPNA
ncbi:MAG: hypothetical protein M1608_15590, partial [Candidatus Omnitrophica bacterium]|nr:hypothetical protein [Candidatus Omnitrophota bacterium]